MLHFTENYFFPSGTSEKNIYKPLQSLGFLPMHTVHQMLHQCNIFKRNSHKTPRETRRIRSRKTLTPSAIFFMRKIGEKTRLNLYTHWILGQF